jgi:hypothetical protein
MTRWGVVLVCFVAFCDSAFSIELNTKSDLRWVESVMPDVRGVLEQNIQACNAEDVEGILATMHGGLPGRDEFADEARQLFEETNIYVRILDVAYFPALTETDPNPRYTRFALEVTQHTSLVDGDSEAYTHFREHSALLPPEYCRYIQTFKLEKGKWKVDKIINKPIELAGPPRTLVNGIPDWFIRENGGRVRSARKQPAELVPEKPCASGNCRKPLITTNSAFK